MPQYESDEIRQKENFLELSKYHKIYLENT
jgi:hypothetical protein